MKILLTDEARRAKYISMISKLLEHFYFYISYTCVECGKDVMSYFASSSSYSNTFLVSAFTISQKSCKQQPPVFGVDGFMIFHCVFSLL